MSSQSAVWDLTLSQDMPPAKRKRTNSYQRKNNYRNAVTRIPRAIKTRGTPNGYYEIPCTTMLRFYGNTSTGVWNTDQSTAGQLGTTGYQGLAFFTSLDSMMCNLGNGSISATVASALGSFSQLAAVFDLVKIVELEFRFWVTNQTSTLNSSGVGAPELWLAEDPNDATPPGNGQILEDYSKVRRVILDQREHRVKIKPHIVMAGGNGTTEANTGYTMGVSQPSTYINTYNLGLIHFGLKGYLWIPSAQSSNTYELNVMIKQTRRYKMNK